MTEDREAVLAVARRAREAAIALRGLTRNEKDAALDAMADALDASRRRDRRGQRGRRRAGARGRHLRRRWSTGSPSPPARIAAIAQALRDVAGLPDPVGEVIRGYTLPNGLQVRQVRVPLGVVGMIYEARPNVTVDAAGLCLKSGNAALLRGSSSAAASNAALVDVMREALAAPGLPADAIQLVPGRHARVGDAPHDGPRPGRRRSSRAGEPP